MKVFYRLAALFVVLFQTMDSTKGEGMVTANLSLGINTTNGSISGGGESAGNTTGDDPMIIGGTVVTNRRSFPWMVYLVCDFGACGSSLISSKHVLTAAHCVIDAVSLTKATRCTAVIGGLTSSYDGDVSGEVTRTASSADIIHHENYFALLYTNDVAVVRFSPAVSPSAGSNINTITLASTDYQGQPVTIVGWGKTECGYPSVLMRGNTLLRTNSECRAEYPPALYNVNTQSCYGGLGQSGVCLGDSGGPVVSGTGDSAVQIAINSFGVLQVGSPLPCLTTTTTRSSGTTITTGTTRSTRTAMATTTPRSGTKSFFNSLMALFIAAPRPVRRGPRSTANDYCSIDDPSVGTKVAAYRTWITNTMNQLV